MAQDTSAAQRPRIRVGIAGLGALASSTMPAFLAHPGFRLHAAAEVRPDVLARFETDYEAEGYALVEELARSDVDAIYVATPTQLHLEHVLTAIAHGKHVLVAKPIAVTLDDADRMIDEAERRGVQLVEAHPQSLEPPLLAMREIIRSGELGSLRMMHTWYYNDWLYRPRLPEELDTAMGGGVTYRQGAHQFDILRMLGGGLIRSVRAYTGRWDSERPTEGAHTVFLDFEDGSVATAVYNGTDHFHSTELTYGIGEGGQVVGDRPYAQARRAIRGSAERGGERALKAMRGYGQDGAMRAPSTARHLPFYGLTIASCERGDIRQSPDGLTIYGDEERRECTLDPSPSGRDAMVAEFYDAIVGLHSPIHSGRWGMANLEVCVAALQSSRERREIMLTHQVPTPD